MLLLIVSLTFFSLFILFFIGLRTYAPVAGPVAMRLRALDALAESRTALD